MPTQLIQPASMGGRDLDNLNDFNYRPVSPTAVVGLVLALMSIAGVFIWLALPICLVAALISLVAIWSVRASRGAYGGGRVAWSGLLLSTAFFVIGLASQVHVYRSEVPEGYTRVSFAQDISAKPFVEQDGAMAVNKDVQDLVGKKIFLKGFIYPTGEPSGLTSFLMLKDNGQCCFGGKPALTDRIGVLLDESNAIDYTAGRVSVAGVFGINPRFTGESDLDPLYLLKAEQVSLAKSDF